MSQSASAATPARGARPDVRVAELDPPIVPPPMKDDSTDELRLMKSQLLQSSQMASAVEEENQELRDQLAELEGLLSTKEDDTKRLTKDHKQSKPLIESLQQKVSPTTT